MDDNVGRLLDWLDANGLRENTVVIYISDQGFFLGEHGLFDKRFMYEESLRMPFLVRWPADNNTRAHCGIRTASHKLIYFWKKDQWECYDLAADPQEMHHIYNDPKARKTVAILEQELWRLKKELKDDDQFAGRAAAGLVVRRGPSA